MFQMKIRAIPGTEDEEKLKYNGKNIKSGSKGLEAGSGLNHLCMRQRSIKQHIDIL